MKLDHWIHLLGVSDVTEVSYYGRALRGIVNSIDTSSPILKGIEEGLYTEDNMKTKSPNKLEKYFEDILDYNQKDCILKNIKTFKELVNHV